MAGNLSDCKWVRQDVAKQLACIGRNKMSALQGADILLVEDNRTDADLTLRALIKNDLGESVVWAKDGAEALDFIFRWDPRTGHDVRLPKVILLDLKMPKVDGFEVLQRVKSDPRTQAVPVVVISASSDESDVASCYRLGANSYLVKPTDLMEYGAMVSQVVVYWGRLNHDAHIENLAVVARGS